MLDKISVFIHCASTGQSGPIIKEILTSLFQSGLYRRADNITLVSLGDHSIAEQEIFGLSKIEIVRYSDDLSYCEFPTLHLMHERAKNYEGLMCYIHTKGATRSSSQVDDWRRLMLHFNISDWNNRVLDLKKFDTTGVNLLGDKSNYEQPIDNWAIHPSTAPLHYSGNFWWTRASYLRTLPSPMLDYSPTSQWLRWRHMCEMWICYNQAGLHECAWQSNVDHYYTNYPEQEYKK